MKTVYNSLRSSLVLVALSASVFFTACEFESDKDYKTEEKDGGGDSLERGTREYHQHTETNPPRDAVKSNDSLQNNVPVTGNDSSVKKDSSRHEQR